MSGDDLTRAENWHGGFYELAIELGNRDDERLAAAVAACWEHPGLDGCWATRESASPRVAATVAHQTESGHLYGIAGIPGFGRTVCGTVVIRETDSGIDWLDLYLPIGALTEVDARADSLWDHESDVPLAWRRPLDDFLVDAARRVHDVAPFALALVGFEVSGTVYRSDLPPDPSPSSGLLMLVARDDGTLQRLDRTA